MSQTYHSAHGAPIQVEAGSQLGSYKVEALIGEGAMGRVFRARHVKLDRTVALKVLHGRHVERPEMIKRFFREARAINQINHENIVEVTDFVEEDGLAYCVMEHLKGQSLESALKKEQCLSVARSAAIMAQVCAALQAAHDHGVIHRDLKPDNIFLVSKGDEEFVKVLDFGVAKLTEPQAGTAYTVEGTVIGTPAYMSPQQASGMPIDRRADIYSAGVVLYRLLSGELPFEAPTFGALLAKLTHDAPNPLPARTPKGEAIPSSLAAAVMKCLAKSPRDRPQKMRDLARVLEGVGAPRPKRRRRIIIRRQQLLGPALGVAAVGGLALFAFLLLKPKEADRVEKELADKVASEIPKVASEIPKVAAEIQKLPGSTPSKVLIDIVSRPWGAVVTWGETGEVLGKTPLKSLLPYRPGGEAVLKLTLGGYEPYVQRVSLGEKGLINATLKPLPKRRKPVRGKHGA